MYNFFHIFHSFFYIFVYLVKYECEKLLGRDKEQESDNDANPVSNKGVKDEDTELLEQDGSEKEVDDETFIISESEDDEKSDDEKDSASKTKGKSKGSKEIDNSSDNDDDD